MQKRMKRMRGMSGKQEILVAGDIMHRAVLEMGLSGRTVQKDEIGSGFVRGRAMVGSMEGKLETIWYYREVKGGLRDDFKIDAVRLYFMDRDPGHGRLTVMKVDQIERAIGRLSWEAEQGLVVWCAAVARGDWVVWDTPKKELWEIWDRRVEKEKVFGYLGLLWKHLYVRMGSSDREIMKCWGGGEDEHWNETHEMREVCHMDERWKRRVCVDGLKKHGHDELVGRVLVWLGLNWNGTGRYRVETIVKGVLGRDEVQKVWWDWRRRGVVVKKIVQAEGILEAHGWEVDGVKAYMDGGGVVDGEMLDRVVAYRWKRGESELDAC